jgi:uncharacterized protein YjbI with pentapeptide repeats
VGADLSDANLPKANLMTANLANAMLTKAILEDADLRYSIRSTTAASVACGLYTRLARAVAQA